MLVFRGPNGLGLGAWYEMPTPTPVQIPTGSTGWTRGAIHSKAATFRARLVAQRNAKYAELQALQAAGQLPSCGKMSLSNLISACTFWTDDDLTDAETNYYLRVIGEDLILPIGVTKRLGVYFAPTEIVPSSDPPRFSKMLTPDVDQRFEMDRAIYVGSQVAISHTFGRDLVGEGHVKRLEQFLLNTGDTDSMIDLFRYMLSNDNITVTDFIHGIGIDTGRITHASGTGTEPLYTTNVPNYGLNPIAPKSGETLINYYRRGGYLISKAIARGQQPVGPPEILSVNAGYCVSDSSACANKVPIASRMLIEPDGKPRGWYTYVTVGPQYKIELVMKEPGTLGKIKEAINKITSAIARTALCAALPAVTGGNSNILKETCADAAGKKCSKGAAGCKCYQATDAQRAGVALANHVITQACSKTPGATPPVTPPVFPTAVAGVPTWAIIVGVLGVGYLILRK